MADNPILSRRDRKLFRQAVMGTTPLGARSRPRKVVEPAASASASASAAADGALFAQAMRGVEPMQVDRAPHYRPRTRPLRRQTWKDHEAVRGEMLSGDFELSELETGDELWFARPGLQHQVLRKLRRGRTSVGAELDLHGMIVAEAHQAVDGFIRRVREANIRCVRIIHGKGNGSLHQRPILKGKVDVWLRRRDEVLAFASARPEDGGTGAVYVLLKGL